MLVPISGDLYPESEKEKDKEEPEWVKTEREHFRDFRDKNKDGKMDRVCFFMYHNLDDDFCKKNVNALNAQVLLFFLYLVVNYDNLM